MKKTFLLCIDQGTTSCKTALINSNLKIVFSNQIKQDNIFHKPGWSETDPVLMYNKVKLLANESLSKAKELGGSVASIGITNQRESCLIWDKKGKPYSNAILWNDLRTIDIVNDFVKAHKGDSYFYQKKTGKPISTYFSALKYKWMIDNIEVIKQKLQNKEDLCFGTIDSWLLFNLTKGKFLTDVTNASRTKLMNIESLNWDQDMCNLFEVPINCLPQILNNTDNFGLSEDLDQKVPITGVIGDQQSACLAHGLKEGEIKNTYGTGGFLLMDIGTKKRFSSNGLLTTVLFSEKNKYATLSSISG